MYGSIENAVKEIANDERKLKEFLSLTDVDEIYEFINDIDPSIEKEEFDEFLVNALGTYVEQNIERMSEYDLKNIAGGTGTLKNLSAGMLSLLALATTALPLNEVGAVSDGSATTSVKEVIKELTEKGYHKTVEWIKANPKKATGIGLIGAGLTLALSKYAFQHKQLASPEQEKQKGQQKGKQENEGPMPIPNGLPNSSTNENSNKFNQQSQGANDEILNVRKNLRKTNKDEKPKSTGSKEEKQKSTGINELFYEAFENFESKHKRYEEKDKDEDENEQEWDDTEFKEQMKKYREQQLAEQQKREEEEKRKEKERKLKREEIEREKQKNETEEQTEERHKNEEQQRQKMFDAQQKALYEFFNKQKQVFEQMRDSDDDSVDDEDETFDD